MAGTVQRWTLRDPATGDVWVFPRNPTKMDKLSTDRSITGQVTVGGAPVYWEAPVAPRAWTFDGVFVSAEHVNTLRAWMGRKNTVLKLTTHRGDVLDLVPVGVDDPEDVTTRGNALQPNRSPFTARFLLQRVTFTPRTD